MRIIKYNILFLTTLITFASGFSQLNSEGAELTIGGTVDTYFKSSPYSPYSSFANLNGFALGMVNLVASYQGGQSGFVADLVYGPRGNDAVFESTDGSNPIVNQLYVYYKVNDVLKLTLGNFNTFLGYEVISPADNFNYSASYMFSYGPFSHTGIKADLALTKEASLMFGILNTTDATEFQPFEDQYMLGIQLGLYGQYLNFLHGNGSTQVDFTGGLNLADHFYLGINASTFNGGDLGSFSGIALYPQVTLSDAFSVGLRGELFSEKEGFGALDPNTIAVGKSISNTGLTLTGSYTSGNFILKPEFRFDKASEHIYLNPDSIDRLAAFIFAAVYTF